MKKRFKVNLDDSAFTKERPPPKPHFQSLFKRGQTPSTSSAAKPASEPVDQPLSYAEYIVQSKSNVAAPPQREGPSKLLGTEDAVVTNLKHSESASVSSAAGGREKVQACAIRTEGVQKSEATQEAGTDQKEGNCQKSDLSLSLGPKPVGSGSSIIVSPRQCSILLGNPGSWHSRGCQLTQTIRPNTLADQAHAPMAPAHPDDIGPPAHTTKTVQEQPEERDKELKRGNPILKFIRSVPWEFGDVVPDYVLGQTTCALFLSLRYHNLNPNYIHDRLKLLGQTFTLRVLLVQVDMKDPHHALRELARICIMADCTLVLAWSPEEAGRYLETYKSYEKKPADILKEQVEKGYLSKVTDCLTTVKSINKTDAITLLSTFSSVEGIISASKDDLVLCPGLGPQKARRLYDVLHKPFLKSKTNNT